MRQYVYVCAKRHIHIHKYIHIYIYTKVAGYVRHSSRSFLLQIQTRETWKINWMHWRWRMHDGWQLAVCFSSRSLVWGCCKCLCGAKVAVDGSCLKTMTTWLSQVTCRLICSVFSTPLKGWEGWEKRNVEERWLVWFCFLKPTSPRPWDKKARYEINEFRTKVCVLEFLF